NTLLVLATTESTAAKIGENTLYSYLIIDEISIVGQKLFIQLHTFMKKVKATDDDTFFTEINILFASDFMQLPLVLDFALYVSDRFTHMSTQFNTQSITKYQ
ncbi:5834_t:CDS:2, partial [Scutellospora calospora]